MKKIVRADYRLIAAKYMKKKNGFKFISLLGKGSYGTVLEMKNDTLGAVAVKIVNRRAENLTENTEWYKLRHPNILKLLKVEDCLPSCVIFVTDLMQTTLTKKLNDKAYQQDLEVIPTNIRYLRDVLNGLSYLHRKNFCHLDLRADNVFIAFDGRAVVSDFSGLCMSCEKKNFCPLPRCFRPPEMFANKRNKVWPAPIDLWAFGLLAVHMFYLKKFFKVIMHKDPPEDPLETERHVKIFCSHQNIRLVLTNNFPQSSFTVKFVEDFSNFISQFLRMKAHKRCRAEDGLLLPFIINDTTQLYGQLSSDGPSIMQSSSASLCSDEIIIPSGSKHSTSDSFDSSKSAFKIPDTVSVSDIITALNSIEQGNEQINTSNSQENNSDSDQPPLKSQNTSQEHPKDIPNLKDLELVEKTSLTLHPKESTEFLINDEMKHNELESSEKTEENFSDLKSRWEKFRWKFGNMKRWKGR